MELARDCKSIIVYRFFWRMAGIAYNTHIFHTAGGCRKNWFTSITSLHCLTSTPKWIWIQPNRNQRWCGGQLQDAETRTHQRLPKDSTLQQGADAEASPTNLDALDNRWLCRAVSGTRDTGLKWIQADVQICYDMFALFFVVTYLHEVVTSTSLVHFPGVLLPLLVVWCLHATQHMLASTTQLVFSSMCFPFRPAFYHIPYITRN